MFRSLFKFNCIVAALMFISSGIYRTFFDNYCSPWQSLFSLLPQSCIWQDLLLFVMPHICSEVSIHIQTHTLHMPAVAWHFYPSIHPLGATALGEPRRPQQTVSIALYLLSSPSTALSSLFQVCYNIIHPSQTRSSFSSAYEQSSFHHLSWHLLPLQFLLHVPTILSFELL